LLIWRPVTFVLFVAFVVKWSAPRAAWGKMCMIWFVYRCKDEVIT
jgi:hypothetical protein